MPEDNKQLEDLAAGIKSLVNEIKNDRKAKQKEDGKSSGFSFDPSLGAEKNKELLKERIALEQDAVKAAQLHIELKRAEIEASEDLLAAELKRDITSKRRAKLMKEHQEKIKSQREELDALIKSSNEYHGSADGVSGALETLTGVSKSFNTTLAGQVVGLFKSREEMKKFGENLEETYTIGNIFESTFQKLGQTALFGLRNMFSELEEGRTSFVKATGASQELTAAVVESSKQFREYGVSVADAGAAQAQLMATFPTRELGDVTTEVAAQFALWQKSGVAIGDSINSYETLRRAFNMTNEDAIGLQKNIMALGDEIGMGGPKMIQSFAKAAPRLAIHGSNMEKIFKRVASSSAQLGLEVNDVLALAEGFQTFEGSAQAAGKLNSILGGGFIDNIQLMSASFEDPAKAAGMIKDAFQSAGQSVESLGPAGVKAAAAAAGFSDVAKFTRFLNGEIDAAEMAADEELTLQKEMTDAAIGTQEILKQFSDAFQSFFNDTLMSPLMEMLQFFSGFGGGVKALIFGVGAALTTALMGVGGALLGAYIGRAEGMVVGPMVAAAVTTGNVTNVAAKGGVGNALGSLMGTGSVTGTPLAGAAGSLMTYLPAVGAVGMLAKDVYDAASGDRSMGNAGAMIGSGIGALGFLGGPLVGAATMAAGNWVGEKIGEYYDKKLEADASITAAKSATDKRLDRLSEIVERQASNERRIEVALKTDEYAYRKGFRLSAEEMLSQQGG